MITATKSTWTAAPGRTLSGAECQAWIRRHGTALKEKSFYEMDLARNCHSIAALRGGAASPR